jgi:deoxyribose-phosphate aldolase
MQLTRQLLASMIDHTTLKPTEGRKKIEDLCEEARMFGFFAVCVNPCYTTLCRELLAGSEVKVAIVTGFPLGMNRTDIKALETARAVEDGADEIDMVMNVAALTDKRHDFVEADVKAVVDAAGGKLVKVILETCYLTDEQIVDACKISVQAGAHFVKTSTGFGAFGAFPHHVKLMRDTVGPDIGVKASGGIMDFKQCWRMIRAGATRLGTSASVNIVEGFNLVRHSPSLLDEEELPCHYCITRSAKLDKLPKGLFRYHVNRCQTCPHRELNRFYD